jgi:hypothetical protein
MINHSFNNFVQSFVQSLSRVFLPWKCVFLSGVLKTWSVLYNITHPTGDVKTLEKPETH